MGIITSIQNETSTSFHRQNSFHFGTTREVLKLMTEDYKKYQLLGWENQVNSSLKSSDKIAALNSVCSVNAECGEDCYLEVSYVHPGSKIGNRVILSYIDIHGETIPDEVVFMA